MAIRLSDIRVRFEGHGAGVGELTWGQLGILRTTQRTGRTMNVVVTMPLPDATPLTEMTALLRFLVSRHPALRTRLCFADEQSAERRAQQVIAGAGEVPLYIADLDDEDDPGAAAEQMRSRFELEWFDYEHEFPVRMGVVRQSGRLVHLVLGYSHVMVDGAGILALTRDLANLERATGQATAPPAGAGPLDIAAAQGSASGRRQSERSIRYWAAQLERLSAWQPAESARPRQPRFWELAGYSPAMDLAMREIAARTGTATTYVLLAAYSAAVARIFGRDPAVAQIVVSNRFRPGFADLAAQLSQYGICVVDTAHVTFDEVVDRARSAATSASFHGYYDPQQCARLLEETAARRGRPLDLSWHLNDRRAMPGSHDTDDSDAGHVKRDGQAGGDEPIDEALTKLLPHTKLFWDRRMPSFDGTLFIQVDSAPAPLASRQALPEGLSAVYFEVWVDTRVFTTDRIERFAREMEAVLVEAACDPKTMACPG